MKLCFILLFIITVCTAGKGPNRQMGTYRQLALTQRALLASYYDLHKVWPPSNINEANSGLPKKTCEAFHNPNRWVVRGLFPHKRSGHSPTSCVPYVEGFVKFYINDNLKQRLETNWPNVISNISRFAHWEHEWHKHGSCVTDLDSMRNVRGYFEKTLELLNDHNIGSLLERHEIHAGGSYSVNRIFDIIKNEYRIEPRMKCITVENSEQGLVQYLFEVIICFSKQIILEDCYSTGYRSCNNETEVIYPSFDVL